MVTAKNQALVFFCVAVFALTAAAAAPQLIWSVVAKELFVFFKVST